MLFVYFVVKNQTTENGEKLEEVERAVVKVKKITGDERTKALAKSQEKLRRTFPRGNRGLAGHIGRTYGFKGV